jgi:hypothetical protein
MRREICEIFAISRRISGRILEKMALGISSKESVFTEGDRSYLDGKPFVILGTTSQVLPHVLRAFYETF